MKIFTTIIALSSLLAATTAIALPKIPICAFDPVKGEYVCPTSRVPPVCTFDPIEGEYVCPAAEARDVSANTSNDLEATLIDMAAASCGQEGVRKCTREREGSVCKNGEWEIIHHCATGQQCGIKNSSFCCRTSGPGFNC